MRLSVTASPAKGQDATIDLTVALVGHGYTVAPHLSAQQVRDRAHLADIVARCREARITDVFVVGGDPTDEPTEFRHAHDLLVSLHELDHGFTDIGIFGHPEGHPTAATETLFQALKDKAPLATHTKTRPRDRPAGLRRCSRRGPPPEAPAGLRRARHRRVGKVPEDAAEPVPAVLHPGRLQSEQDHKGLAPHVGKPDNGIEGFHVFTFNDLGPTEAWRQRMLRDLA